MEIYTIGFKKRSAAEFFGALRYAGITRLVDVRPNNSVPSVGFARHADLRYLLREICTADYIHEPQLAPSDELLQAYRAHELTWDQYAERFRALLVARRVDAKLDRELFVVPSVLLCSEPLAEYCHRRLVAEYLKERWGDVTIHHL